MNDTINQPKHYTQHPSGVECITITEEMPFNIGTAVAYLWRVGLKEGASDIHDLKKARWFIEREIARRERMSKEKNDITKSSTAVGRNG